VGTEFLMIREALLLSASVQLRNMATIGGNLLQRTRCRYFRDPTVACNKRSPGTGCSALEGHHRMHAVLATSEYCFATHASDVAVAFVALDALVHTTGQEGSRRIPLTRFYTPPGDTPNVETVLVHGELITSIEVPLLPPGALGLSQGSGPGVLRIRACIGCGRAGDRRWRDPRGPGGSRWDRNGSMAGSG
jgi:CO/xanthine dehydrogenase FAD-binding subunit